MTPLPGFQATARVGDSLILPTRQTPCVARALWLAGLRTASRGRLVAGTQPILKVSQGSKIEQGFAQFLDLRKRQAANAIRDVLRQSSTNLGKLPQQEADATSRFPPASAIRSTDVTYGIFKLSSNSRSSCSNR